MDAQERETVAICGSRSPRRSRGLPSCWRRDCGRATARGCWRRSSDARLTSRCSPRCLSSPRFIALPASSPPCRRRAMREASEVASALAALRRWRCGSRERSRACRSMRICCARARSGCACPSSPPCSWCRNCRSAQSGVAGGHRAAAGTAPQAPRGLRTQDARAHRVGPAARRSGGVHSAAGAAGAARGGLRRSCSRRCCS